MLKFQVLTLHVLATTLSTNIIIDCRTITFLYFHAYISYAYSTQLITYQVLFFEVQRNHHPSIDLHHFYQIHHTTDPTGNPEKKLYAMSHNKFILLQQM